MTATTIADRPRGAAFGPDGAALPGTLAAGPHGPTLPEDVVDIIRGHLLFRGDGGRAFFSLALVNTGHWQRSCALTASGPTAGPLAHRMGETIAKATASMNTWHFIGEEAHATYQKNVATALTRELASLRLLPAGPAGPAGPAAAARIPAFCQKVTALEAAARAQDEKGHLDGLAEPSPASNAFFRRVWRGCRNIVYFPASGRDRREDLQLSATPPVEVEKRLGALHQEIRTYFPPDRYTSQF